MTLAEGRQRPVCSDCGFVVYMNPAPSVAAVLVKDGRVLLVKRNIEPGFGKWCLPGGFIEEDESAEDAVVREVFEETGLHCRTTRLLDAHSMRSAVYGSIIVLCYEADGISEMLEAGGDAADADYFPLEQLPPIAFDNHDRFIKKYAECPHP